MFAQLKQSLKKIQNRVFLTAKPYFCPLCERRFNRFDDYKGSYYLRGALVDHFTPNSICPSCGSDLRHRLLAVFFEQRFGSSNKRLKLLHFAPEEGMYGFFSRHAIDYTTCDLEPNPAFKSLKVDMTKIDFPDESFDVVVNIHVLEHIHDDRKAIRELYRILRPGGSAVIAIPTYGPITFEDPSLDAEGRTKMYGIDQHVRLNGLDFQEKLRDAGFKVNLESSDSILGDYVDRTVSSPHTESDRYIFFCQK